MNYIKTAGNREISVTKPARRINPFKIDIDNDPTIRIKPKVNEPVPGVPEKEERRLGFRPGYMD